MLSHSDRFDFSNESGKSQGSSAFPTFSAALGAIKKLLCAQPSQPESELTRDEILGHAEAHLTGVFLNESPAERIASAQNFRALLTEEIAIPGTDGETFTFVDEDRRANFMPRLLNFIPLINEPEARIELLHVLDGIDDPDALQLLENGILCKELPLNERFVAAQVLASSEPSRAEEALTLALEVVSEPLLLSKIGTSIAGISRHRGGSLAEDTVERVVAILERPTGYEEAKNPKAEESRKIAALESLRWTSCSAKYYGIAQAIVQSPDSSALAGVVISLFRDDPSEDFQATLIDVLESGNVSTKTSEQIRRCLDSY